MSGYFSRLKSAGTQTLFTNINTRIFHQLTDFETNQWVSKSCGKEYQRPQKEASFLWEIIKEPRKLLFFLLFIGVFLFALLIVLSLFDLPFNWNTIKLFGVGALLLYLLNFTKEDRYRDRSRELQNLIEKEQLSADALGRLKVKINPLFFRGIHTQAIVYKTGKIFSKAPHRREPRNWMKMTFKRKFPNQKAIHFKEELLRIFQREGETS